MAASEIKITKVLYPTDFSQLSLHAMRYAEYFAEKLSAELHCLHVVDDSYQQVWLMTEMPSVPVGPPIEEMLAAGQRQLDDFLKDHLSRNVRCIKVVRRGRPFLEIISYTRREGIALIVMGTHGRTALRQALMGSVADKVVRKSPCPVMTVRAPGHGFEMP